MGSSMSVISFLIFLYNVISSLYIANCNKDIDQDFYTFMKRYVNTDEEVKIALKTMTLDQINVSLRKSFLEEKAKLEQEEKENHEDDEKKRGFL